MVIQASVTAFLLQGNILRVSTCKYDIYSHRKNLNLTRFNFKSLP